MEYVMLLELTALSNLFCTTLDKRWQTSVSGQTLQRIYNTYRVFSKYALHERYLQIKRLRYLWMNEESALDYRSTPTFKHFRSSEDYINCASRLDEHILGEHAMHKFVRASSFITPLQKSHFHWRRVFLQVLGYLMSLFCFVPAPTASRSVIFLRVALVPHIPSYSWNPSPSHSVLIPANPIALPLPSPGVFPFSVVKRFLISFLLNKHVTLKAVGH